MPDINQDIQDVLDAYCRLTGREAKMPVYEHAIWDFIRAGFDHQDMATVIQFIMRENRRNHYQYSLKLGHLINDHMRFQDLLSEAKARHRNLKPLPTPKEQALAQLRPVVGEPVTTTRTALSVEQILKRIGT